MLISEQHRQSLNSLFHILRIRSGIPGTDGSRKAEQILAYLEVIESCVRKLSAKRTLVLIDSAAGNCYLSFLVYHYFNILCKREIIIHCIDSNKRLMENCGEIAASLGFSNMIFHSGDILETVDIKNADISYSLHACDTATDKALYLGLKLQSKWILSVGCCQHSIRKKFKNSAVKGVTRYKSCKDQLVYLVADTMRAHLVGAHGYKADIFEFTSSRNTDKNKMIRARKTNQFNLSKALLSEYKHLQSSFGVQPYLAKLLERRTK
jgi:hypothetical protein